MLRLLKRLYLVFFRGDLDKILQRHLEMMDVYLSDRALQSRDAWPQSYQIGKSWSAYYLYGKPGNSGKNSYATVHRGGNFFGKKVMPFEVLPFSRFYRKDQNFLYLFFWITSARLQVERKRKIYRYFVNGTTQSRSCFLCHKKIPVIFDGNFSPKFPYKW